MALSSSLKQSLLCLPVLGLYWLIFLRQPVVEGATELPRAAFVLNTLLLPESLVASWTGSGRLSLGWLDRLPIIAATGLWLVFAALACPVRIVSRSAKSKPASQWLFELSLSVLVGLAMLSTVTLLVGLAGGLGGRAPLIIAISSWLVASGVLRRSLSFDVPPVVTAARSTAAKSNAGALNAGAFSYGVFDSALQKLAVALTLVCGGFIMLGAWVPPAEFDVLEYHLQAPKEFHQQGRIGFVAHNIYANMPLGVEMHALAAMTLWPDEHAWLGGLVGKSVSAAITLLGASLLGSWLAMRSNALTGWWSAGLWLATPGIAHVAMQGLIDGALATYCLATAICVCQLFSATRSESPRASIQTWLILCGLLGGATAGIKYPGLIFATLPCLAAIFVVQNSVAGRPSVQSSLLQRACRWLGCGGDTWDIKAEAAPQHSIVTVLTILLCLGITCVPWYAKNWVLAGNPVYPLAANVFGGHTLTQAKISQWQTAHKVPPATDLPSDVARLLMTSSFVQPAMILGLAMAVVLLTRRLRNQSAQPRLGDWYLLGVWSVWLLAVWWLATHRIDRFWLPITGFWAALAAVGAIEIRRASIWLAHGIIVPGLIYGTMVNCSPIVSDNRYFVSLASLRDDIGDQDNPPRVPLAQEWINRNLEHEKAKVLLVGEARVFEYRVPVLYSTCFDTNPGEELLAGKSPDQQRRALASAGITHIMINWVEIDRYRSPGNYGFSSWPQSSDIQAMIDAGVVERVMWNLGKDRADLLMVKP